MFIPLCQSDPSLPYIRLPKTPSQYVFTLKLASAMSAEMFDNFLYSTRLISENRSGALNYSHENLRTRMFYSSSYSKNKVKPANLIYRTNINDIIDQNKNQRNSYDKFT
jgi:hypothetical protein